ncbi:MAG TPA: pitrilysin family protein [Chthoniobacterales bacterium]
MVVTTALLQAKEVPVTAAPSLPESKAQIFTLPNGLTVIIEEDHSAPVASVQVWCATGSIHEGKWMGAGLSHILEHMLFKGTPARGGGQIARQIQEQGGYINAYTSYDRTVYWIDVPSSGVSQAVEILSDAMMNSTLPEDEYTKEQEVIRREYAMGFDDPNRMGIQLLMRTVFGESPYQHPIIGYLDVYNKLTRQDVLDYYKSRYVPNNLTFVISGDVDAAKLKTQLETYFEKYPRAPLPPVFIPTEPEQMGRREVNQEFPTELTRLYLAWRVPGMDHPDAAALEILGQILGAGRSSILNLDIREKQQLAHSISAGVFSMPGQGVFFVGAVTDPDKRAAVETEALKLIEQLKARGVTAEEVEKSRRNLLSSQLSALTTARGKASDLGSNWQLTRNLDFGREFLRQVNAVTPADVRRVAQRYLVEDTLTLTSLNPIGSLAQSRPEETKTEAAAVQKFELSNGLRLLVREDSRLPLVDVTAVFRGGLLAETAADNGITQLLSRTLLKGTQTRSAEQIASQIESVGGSIGSDAGNNSFNVSVEVMKPDLKLGIELLADVLQHPTFPKTEVELEKKSQIASIKADEDQPTTIARNALRERLFGSHPYALRSKGTAQTVASLTPEQLRELHRELVTAKNGVIAVFGDVKAAEVKALIEKNLGSLPAGQLALTQPPQPEKIVEKAEITEERNKQQAVIMVGYQTANALSPDRPALELIDEACSDLGSRFFDRIREQQALAYFVGSSQMMGLAPGLFAFYAGTDPKKADYAKSELVKEIAELAKTGLTSEELARAKKKLLGSEAISNQSNSSFAQACAINELQGLGYDYYQKREAEIQGITLADTQRVASKYFANPPVEVMVRPPAAPKTN